MGRWVGMDPVRQQRDDAWVGDAVLALVVREWILATVGTADGELQSALTSNRFLSRFGNPTAVEAGLGRLHAAHGVEAARVWFRERMLPAALPHLRRHHPALASRIRQGEVRGHPGSGG